MATNRLLTHSVCFLLLAAGAYAQNQCRFDLANHSDGATSGLILSVEAKPDSNGKCQLSSVTLGLSVGDGISLHNVRAPFLWQIGMVYTAKAVITAAGPQQLSINGQSAGSVQGGFKPTSGLFYGSLVADSGTASEAYIVSQISLQVSSGANVRTVAPNGGNPIPPPLILLGGGPALWQTAFSEDPAQTITITATFQFDTAVSNPHQLDPYIDTYGQAIAASWPSKVTSDSDLQTAAAQEQAWLANNPPLGALDQYGGSTVAGWTDKTSEYYHTAFHGERWYLISPLGNPLFYLGLTAIGDSRTPITGRESMFQLPPQNGDLAAAYSRVQGVTEISFPNANQIRKYGSSWQETANTLYHQRLAAWGFTGGGKFGDFPADLPSIPVLEHGSTADVPAAVPGGHPDIFDSNIVSRLKASLAAQMGSNITSKYIVGWSVGNEIDEVIQSSEVTAILGLGASSPAKVAFVEHALDTIYGGNVGNLATAWKITATTVADVEGATNAQPPAADIEALRDFYASTYYLKLYQTVKAIDPNHLYFGIWLLHGDERDWAINAANCDVVGFDDFEPAPLNPDLQKLFTSTNKPVMIGAWGVPADYGGARGFGWKTGRVMALTDAASGDVYAQLLASFAANPYVVGSMIFEYNDQPLTGSGPGSGSDLVIPSGTDLAWGMVDVTDTPKYDFVNKVRASNIATLQSVGLLGATSTLTPGSLANGATYVAGGLVSGSWAQVKGTNLSNSPVTWDSFFGPGNSLPTNLNGVEVKVNGAAAAVYYASPAQVSFQVPNGITGTATVQVFNNGVGSNPVTAQAATSSPGIFPIILNGTNYAAGVFLDGKIVGDPANGPAFRNAKPGDVIQLFATGLVPTAAGVLATPQAVSGVTVTIGGITVNADYAGLAYAGEFQINFTVPQQFANRAPGNYPITIAINGVSSPTAISSDPPGAVVLPVQH